MVQLCRLFCLGLGKNKVGNQLTRIFRWKATKHVPCTSYSSTVGTLDESPNAKGFDEIPGPKGLPFIGTVLDYRIMGQYKPENYHNALLDRHKQHGKIFKETIAGHTAVHLFDPDYFRTLFQSEDKTPYVSPLLETVQMYRKKRNLSLGLGNSNGEEWYRLRSAVQQMMMRPKEVASFFHLGEEVASDFLERIKTKRDKNNEMQNFVNEIKKWTLETSAMTCFETRLGAMECQPDSDLQRMIDANNAIFTLSRKLYFSLPLFKLFPTPTWQKLLDTEDFFYGKGKELIDTTVTKIQELLDQGLLEDGQYGFLRYLLSRKDMDYKDVVIITLSLFGDGLSTTSPTTVGQLYCLASNEEKQEKLYEEVCRIAPLGEPLTSEKINRMSYLKACVKEGFRFFPIGPDVAREAKKDLVIGGYTIPKGTRIEMNNFALLRSQEYFKDPEVYLPERWLRGGSAHDIHPYLLTPFGHGPRMCAGRRFAEQEMYILLTKLVQNFKIRWKSEKKLSQTFQMLFVPDSPAHFEFVDRK